MAYSFVDWETKTPGTEVRLREGYFSLPAFSLSDQTWEGYTELVRQYNYNASSKFVIVNPPSRPSSPTFLLCVRWRSGETVTRYKLWDDQGQALGLVGAPIYEGQVIPKNFVLEIWTIKDETAPTLASALTITTTIRKLPIDYRDVSNYEDDSSPSVVTDYSVQMPTRGTGHVAIYDNNYFNGVGYIDVDEPVTTPLTEWTDASGNNYTLDQLVNTPLVVFPLNTKFKDNFKAEFTGESIGTDENVSYQGGFIAFRADSWVDGESILTGYFDVTMFDNGGQNDIKIDGIAAGVDIPLNTDVLLWFDKSKILANPNATINVRTFGDYEVSVTNTDTDSGGVAAPVVLGDSAGTVQLWVAAVILWPGTTVGTLTYVPKDDNWTAERDYLINTYIGWTVDGSFDSGVAGDDNA